MTQEPLWQPSDIGTEPANEGDGPRRRGRIPQSAWPRILEMYKGGATLSAIAREFECTPSAISYIIRKAESGEGDAPAEPMAGTQDAHPQAAPAPAAAPATAAGDSTPRPQPVAAEAAEQRPERQERPERAERPEREPRGERQPGEARRPLTMGGLPGMGPGAPAPRPPAVPQGQPPRGDDIRHSGGRTPDATRQGEGRRPDHRNAEPRGPESRGPESRGPEGRGFEPRGQQGGEGRGFGNRPPREEARSEGRPEGRMMREDVRPMRENRYAAEEQDDMSEVGRFNRPAGHAAYPYRQQRNPARQEAQETPTEPADQRMDAAAKSCAELYRAWKANGGEEGMQALADALHEMRKVMARMEIEMSASRREEQRPVPIPAYRTNQPAPQQPRG